MTMNVSNVMVIESTVVATIISHGGARGKVRASPKSGFSLRRLFTYSNFTAIHHNSC